MKHIFLDGFRTFWAGFPMGMLSEKLCHQIEAVRHEFAHADQYSAEYESHTPMGHFFNTRLKNVQELLKDFDHGKVLDVGCGPAKAGRLFRDRDVEYHGVDVSKDMLAQAEAEYKDDPRFRFSLSAAEDLPFDQHAFDVVLCLGAFEYMLDETLSELARVTRTGGTVLVTMHNPHSPYRFWPALSPKRLLRIPRKIASKLRRRSEPGGANLDKLKFYMRSEKNMRQLFDTNGIRVDDVIYYDFNLFVPPLDEIFPDQCVALSERLEKYSRSRLRTLCSGFIIKGTRQ